MRNQDRAGLTTAAAAVLAAWVLTGCAGDSRVEVPGAGGRLKSAAAVRAERRAYDGAPPVAPHEDFGLDCLGCHNEDGMEVEDLGFAPPSPHGRTSGVNEDSRCRQCHVFGATDAVFVASSFVGLRQDLRHGARLHVLAPPTIPHKTFMRENCAACHTGPAAREEVRTSHPERQRCRQCHVPVTTRASFSAREHG